MLKKLLKLLKFMIKGIIWSYLYASFASLITVYFWSFNLFSAQNREIIKHYWNSGRTIGDTNDFIFLTALLVLFIFWIIGLFWFVRRNHLKWLLFPVTLYNRYISNKYGKDSPRIILKNLGIIKKLDVEELVEERLAQEPDKKPEKIDIRTEVKKKIESSKK